MLTAFVELMTERDPVFLNQHLKAFKSSVVWVKHQLSERTELGSAVPAIRTVNQDVLLLSGRGVEDHISAR